MALQPPCASLSAGADRSKMDHSVSGGALISSSPELKRAGLMMNTAVIRLVRGQTLAANTGEHVSLSCRPFRRKHALCGRLASGLRVYFCDVGYEHHRTSGETSGLSETSTKNMSHRATGVWAYRYRLCTSFCLCDF